MGKAFATRNASAKEIQLLRLFLSTFRDGSGNQKEGDGSTRANWREIERCVAELLGESASEDKNIFDVIAADDDKSSALCYGYSIKSKQLARPAFNELSSSGRVYMEIANSPAKFWAEILKETGLREDDFRNGKSPERIGNTVIAAVKKWHQEGKNEFEHAHSGKKLDLENSCYLCVSYSQEADPNNRSYQLHAFSLDYPKGIRWKYKSELCLTGYDPAHPSEALIDWYGLSGGQLKYYPRGSSARFTSPAFNLLNPGRKFTLMDKAKVYFPRETE